MKHLRPNTYIRREWLLAFLRGEHGSWFTAARLQELWWQRCIDKAYYKPRVYAHVTIDTILRDLWDMQKVGSVAKRKWQGFTSQLEWTAC